MDVMIDEKGSVRSVKIVSGPPLLAVSAVTGVGALAPVQQWWSPEELAMWLFTVYALIAAVPKGESRLGPAPESAPVVKVEGLAKRFRRGGLFSRAPASV